MNIKALAALGIRANFCSKIRAWFHIEHILFLLLAFSWLISSLVPGLLSGFPIYMPHARPNPFSLPTREPVAAETGPIVAVISGFSAVMAKSQGRDECVSQ